MLQNRCPRLSLSFSSVAWNRCAPPLDIVGFEILAIRLVSSTESAGADGPTQTMSDAEIGVDGKLRFSWRFCARLSFRVWVTFKFSNCWRVQKRAKNGGAFSRRTSSFRRSAGWIERSWSRTTFSGFFLKYYWLVIVQAR